MPQFRVAKVRWVFRTMLDCYGVQDWWPGESVLEIMIGAILTQNTNWRNVEQALVNLRSECEISLDRLLSLPVERLADLIRPSGHFNVKARRLRHLLEFVDAKGGDAALAEWTTSDLRQNLLGLNGVGPETADAILLYAFGRPVFVVDTYFRRLFRRLGLINGDEPYEQLRGIVERTLDSDSGLLNELHALIVAHGKDFCRPKPRCRGCCLRDKCLYRPQI